MLKKPSSKSRGKSSVFKGLGNVEDEEGDTILLDTGKLISSPSILSTTNQGYGERDS